DYPNLIVTKLAFVMDPEDPTRLLFALADHIVEIKDASSDKPSVSQFSGTLSNTYLSGSYITAIAIDPADTDRGRFNLRGNSHGGITDVAFRISRCAFERNRFDSEFVQIAVAA
ncbi:MAG: hypothetical protein WB810_10010, partial [Candidatus Cybelea sp.]